MHKFIEKNLFSIGSSKAVVIPLPWISLSEMPTVGVMMEITDNEIKITRLFREALK